MIIRRIIITLRVNKVNNNIAMGRAEDPELRQPRKKPVFFRLFRIVRGLNDFLGVDLGPSSSLVAPPRRVPGVLALKSRFQLFRMFPLSAFPLFAFCSAFSLQPSAFPLNLLPANELCYKMETALPDFPLNLCSSVSICGRIKS